MVGITVKMQNEFSADDVLLLLCGVEKNVNIFSVQKPLHMTAHVWLTSHQLNSLKLEVFLRTVPAPQTLTRMRENPYMHKT